MAERIAQTFNTFGSVVRRGPNFNLRADQLVLGRNCRPIADGSIVGRGGFTEFGDTGAGTGLHSLFRWYRQDDTGILLAGGGGNLYKATSPSTTFTNIGSLTNSATFTPWASKDKVYIASSSNALRSYDGTTLATVGGSPPLTRNYELHENRLFAFKSDLVYFSDLNVDDSWPGTNILNLADPKGGREGFLKSYNGALIIAKTTGLWRFQGSPVLAAELEQFSDVGALINRPAVRTPFGVVFVGLNGIYVTDGFGVQRISDEIESLFPGPFSGGLSSVGAAYYDRHQQYWLAFDNGSGGRDLWVATRVLRPGGATIEWHEYTGLPSFQFAVFDGATDNGDIYFSHDTNGKVYQADTGSLDDGVKYNVDVQTRYDDFGQPLRNKQVVGIEAFFNAPNPATVNIKYNAGRSTKEITTPERVEAAGSSIVSGRWETLRRFKGDGRTVSTLIRSTDGPDFSLSQLTLEARLKSRRIRRDRISFGSY